MHKVFILDTNVLVHDPEALTKFETHDIVIPITVLEELDGLKKGMNEVGRNARESTRKLDAMREEGALDEGVDTAGGGVLTVVSCTSSMLNSLPGDLPDSTMDNRILAVAKHYTTAYSCMEDTHTVILVSNDANMRVKANAIGVMAQEYKNDKVNVDELYSGHCSLLVTPEEIAKFYQDDDHGGGYKPPPEHDLYPNQCVMLINNQNLSNTGLGRYVKDIDTVVRICGEVEPLGLIAKNREQQYLLDLLLDPDIKMVTVVGKAGSGKTLLALAAGLHMVMEDSLYKRVVVARPVVPAEGQDLGFLPGDEQEKLMPWMHPIFDNVEVLMPDYGEDAWPTPPKKFSKQPEKAAGFTSPAQELISRGYLELSPLAYIRGRSMPDQYLIVDEAQNLSPHMIKTIVTRAGEGTKIILTGDPQQIDNPYLDACSNGLTYAAERFKGEPIAGHITLVKGERSLLAELAAELL